MQGERRMSRQAQEEAGIWSRRDFSCQSWVLLLLGISVCSFWLL